MYTAHYTTFRVGLAIVEAARRVPGYSTCVGRAKQDLGQDEGQGRT